MTDTGDGRPGTEGRRPGTEGRRKRSVVRSGIAAVSIVAGLLVGLVVAELAFSARDGGAFPRVNLYRADAELGLVLRPHATEQVRFGGAPTTTVRTNAQGFRGPDWGAPADGEILVIGDSQAFGLGVEEHETFAAKLAKQLGVPVLNAAVPTHGPPEYNLLLERLLQERRPQRIIWVVNLYNDLFEADRPNVNRHAEWDGWAVRQETAPVSITAFPGRELIYRQSHLFFAFRRYFWGKAAETDLGLPSEGTYEDVVVSGKRLGQEKARAERLEHAYRHLSEFEHQHTRDALASAQQITEKIAYRNLPYQMTAMGEADISQIRATPGDIVDYGGGGEFSRPGPVTAAHIKLAARMRQNVVTELQKRAQEVAAKPAAQRSAQERQLPADTLSVLKREQELEQREQELRQRSTTLVRGFSPIAKHIARAQELADSVGAELLVVALPMDVQISNEEWKKYGTEPLEMADTHVLVEDTVETARALGARGLDLTDALVAAEPGAFLPADLHLTPKGHAAVAQAIADSFEARRIARPRGGLPPGRSRVPDYTEWNSIGETLVWGSSARGCVTKRLREYVAIFCRGGDRWNSLVNGPEAVQVRSGGRGELAVARYASPGYEYDWDTDKKRYDYVPTGKTQYSVTLVSPVLPGDRLEADFYWKGVGVSRLAIEFPADGDDVVEFGKFRKDETLPATPVTKAAQKICDCHRELTGARDCTTLPAASDPDCVRTYGDSCHGLLECASGSPLYPPQCASGQANGTPRERCFPLCDASTPCQTGACVKWQGGGLCLPTGGELPAPPPPRVVAAAALTYSPEVVALAGKLVDAGAAVTKGCTLKNVDQESYWNDVYDDCPFEKSQLEPVRQAVGALQAHLKQHPEDARGAAELLAMHGGMFLEWLELIDRGAFNRGILPRFAEMVEVYNLWMPDQPKRAYTDALLKSYRTGKRTKAVAAYSKDSIEWKRCRGGPCL